MFKRFAVFLVLIFLTQINFAQITLNNASFEDEPSDATTPHGWFVASPMTTPDILPGYWGVYLDAEEGDTYIGLITRHDDSFESIGQRTSAVMKSELCYSFALELAHSKTYAGFNNAVKLRIWIGSSKNKKEQLIYESHKIEHSTWRNYKVNFTPKADAQYFFIEAYNDNPSKPQKSNILIDNISVITQCSKV